MQDAINAYGWTALPRDPEIILNGKKNINDPKPQTVNSINLPSTPLAKAVLEFARNELSEQTFNHSMRVYYYGAHTLAPFPRRHDADYRTRLIGKAIHFQQFPGWGLTDETYLLTCLLHDIGTTEKNISATLMSFEFYGGFLALDLLHKQQHAPIEQAESVVEAIIRHQDIGKSGKISTLGQLIQLATIFGEHPT